MVFFRYSGSVYHTAIMSEALYLVLLLKYPYYNELNGSMPYILVSWSKKFFISLFFEYQPLNNSLIVLF